MRTFYVLWTFSANYSRLIPVAAETAEQAAKETCGYFREEFRQKATVFVFDAPPALITHRGVDYPRTGDTASRFTYNVDRRHVDAYREASRKDD
jgi:hypothetical protein